MGPRVPGFVNNPRSTPSPTMPPDTDLQSLLARIAARDAAALRALYAAASGRLLAVAGRILDDRAAAEDVVQDVFMTVWTRAAQFPTLHASPLAWLTSMTRNRAIDLVRRRRPETTLVWQDAEGQEHQHDIADDSGSPLDQLMAVQSEGRLGDCMAQLDDEPRAALRLAYYEGLTHDELSARIGRPLGTVKAWIRRSLLRLRACLGEPA
jgi:RNA polymerase sigma-70 factor (ECF subfamily)